MTNENVQRLKQATSMALDSRQSASLYPHERAPRQLLVNESVLRRNQFYRQQSAVVQTSPSQLGFASALSCGDSSRGAIKNPANKMYLAGTSAGASTPNRTSHSDMNPVGVSKVSI